MVERIKGSNADSVLVTGVPVKAQRYLALTYASEMLAFVPLFRHCCQKKRALGDGGCHIPVSDKLRLVSYDAIEFDPSKDPAVREVVSLEASI